MFMGDSTCAISDRLSTPRRQPYGTVKRYTDVSRLIGKHPASIAPALYGTTLDQFMVLPLSNPS